MLKCKDVSRLSSDYIDGDMGVLMRWRIGLHILTCHHCRRFVRQMRATVRLLHAMPDQGEPARVDDELTRAFKAATGRKRHG